MCVCASLHCREQLKHEQRNRELATALQAKEQESKSLTNVSNKATIIQLTYIKIDCKFQYWAPLFRKMSFTAILYICIICIYNYICIYIFFFKRNS